MDLNYFLSMTQEQAIDLGVRALAVITVLTVAWQVLRYVYRGYLRSRASADLGVALGRRFRVRRSRPYRQTGAFTLAYPRWRYANKDATRDRRRSDNRVIRRQSVLEVHRWRILCGSVFVMYDLVLRLRAAGVPVELSDHEQVKARVTGSRAAARASATSIDGLLASFSTRPTDFEPFCADLFRAHGFQAEVTPPSRDGGIDLRLWKDGLSYVVECKCYDRSHTVGRPVVQKLRGANTVEGADRMMVVTTSRFTRDAVTYAQQAGVQLVDGEHLVRLCHEAWGTSLPAAPDVALTREEILTGFPQDMPARYLV